MNRVSEVIRTSMSSTTRSMLRRYVVALLVLATLTGLSFLVVRSLISDMRETEVVIAEASDLRSDIHKTMLALDEIAAHAEPKLVAAARVQAELLKSRLDHLLNLLSQAGVGPEVWAIVRHSEKGLERSTRILIERGSASHPAAASSMAEPALPAADAMTGHGHQHGQHGGHASTSGNSVAMIAIDDLIGTLRESARANQARAGLIHDALGAGILLILLVEAGIIFWPLVRKAESETRRAEHATHELEYLARHDALTGLLNRAQIDSVLKMAVQKATSANQQLGLILLDLDEFKPINDAFGHAAGDAVLIAVAERIRGVLRDHHIAGRLGGDEFIVVLPDVSHDDEVKAMAETILQAVSTDVLYEGRQLTPGASIGFALFPIAGTEVGALMSAADLAMYAAKRSGRGRVSEFSQAMRAEAERSRSIQVALKNALLENQFEVFYQTIHSGRDGAIAAIEALVRWRHPQRGILPPENFLGELKRLGLMAPLTKIVLSSALAQFAAWRAAGLILGPIHINVGDDFLRDPASPQALGDALRQHKLDASEVVLEITDDVSIAHEQVIATMDALQAIGVRLAVDDWGAGKVSLLELSHPAIDMIKVDRKLIDQAFGSDTPGVLAALLELPRSIGKMVVAEGIETEEMAILVRAAGANLLQGHHYGTAQSATDTTVQLARLARKSGISRTVA